MKKGLLALASILLISASALACHITGKVSCPNQFVVPGVTLNISGPNGFTIPAVTAADGTYIAVLPGPGEYSVTLDTSTLPPNTAVVGGNPQKADVPYGATVTVDWAVTGEACGTGCWFTGGGALVDPLLGIPVATHGGGSKKRPTHAFGGNVYPGCSPTAGDGGNWNHVARGNIKLHFHGTQIHVVRCGNVTPPPDPGSTSPKTPYNFIEWEGTGWIKGITGNKADYDVSFFARTEDRNEPGSTGPSAGALIDRYYLRVWETANPSNILLLITDDDTDPMQVLPTPITDGNFQLHISSCDKPPKP